MFSSSAAPNPSDATGQPRLRYLVFPFTTKLQILFNKKKKCPKRTVRKLSSEKDCCLFPHQSIRADKARKNSCQISRVPGGRLFFGPTGKAKPIESNPSIQCCPLPFSKAHPIQHSPHRYEARNIGADHYHHFYHH